MFPLQTKTFPSTASDLTTLMNQSLGRIFLTTVEPVRIESDAYPALRSVHIALDGAALRPGASRPAMPVGEATPALHVQDLTIAGSRLSIGPAMVDLALSARDVRFDQNRDTAQEIVLVLKSAAEGHVEIAAAKAELEKAIAAVAALEAGKQGVTIEDVSLSLQERGTRSLSGEVRVKARKLFFSTVIRIAAELNLDQDLKATISGLKCSGEGAIGSLACGILSPHLQKLEGRSFSLLALPLGEIRLRDVRLSASDEITVQAEFGT